MFIEFCFKQVCTKFSSKCHISNTKFCLAVTNLQVALLYNNRNDVQNIHDSLLVNKKLFSFKKCTVEEIRGVPVPEIFPRFLRPVKLRLFLQNCGNYGIMIKGK